MQNGYHRRSTRVLTRILENFGIYELDYRTLDALYYWSLCLGSSGARLSYMLKYGSTTLYDIAISRIVSRTSPEELYDVQMLLVRELERDQDFCITLEQDVLNRCRRLSDDARGLIRVLSVLDIPRSLRLGNVEQLQLSSSINLMAKKMFRQHSRALSALFEIIGAGLVITCCWAQYEGFPHMYTVPKYAYSAWYMLSRTI